MPEPWDRPPLPKRGNRSDRVLFKSIGRALNAWEEVEISMAHLCAAFATGDRFDSQANHAYGEPSNFNARRDRLQHAAERYFLAHPSQDVEGEFCRLMRLATGYSARRNDIAHGHSLPIQWTVDPAARPSLLSIAGHHEWCLVPPHFSAKKFTGKNRPAYAFTSREVHQFGQVFWDIAHAVSNLSIWAIQHGPSPYTRPQPSKLPYKVRHPKFRI